MTDLSEPLQAASTPRVVSLDSCSDQLLLALADDVQILALSQDARGPFSYLRERASLFPQHHGSAEEILLMEPDLVLSTGAGDPLLADMLERFGIEVYSTGLPNSIEESLEDLIEVGGVLGQQEKAARIIKSTRMALQALQSAGQGGDLAVYVSPSGITTGSGTFLHEIMELAGLKNLMAERGIEGWGRFDLESFLDVTPDILITSFFDSQLGSAESWRFAAHPVMKGRMEEALVIDVPSRLLSCPAWFAVEGAAFIREELLRGERDEDAS